MFDATCCVPAAMVWYNLDPPWSLAPVVQKVQRLRSRTSYLSVLLLSETLRGHRAAIIQRRNKKCLRTSTATHPIWRGVKKSNLLTAALSLWACRYDPRHAFASLRMPSSSVGRYRIGFRMATWIFVPAQFALLAYACYAVNTVDLTALEFFGQWHKKLRPFGGLVVGPSRVYGRGMFMCRATEIVSFQIFRGLLALPLPKYYGRR